MRIKALQGIGIQHLEISHAIDLTFSRHHLLSVSISRTTRMMAVSGG